jgi:hypothetical protein
MGDTAASTDPIAADIEDGEALILLVDLRDQDFMPRPGGKKLDKSVPFRWASRGSGGHLLEKIQTPTGLATTRAAVLRFYAALSGSKRPPGAGSKQRRRHAVAAASRDLEAAGI